MWLFFIAFPHTRKDWLRRITFRAAAWGLDQCGKKTLPEHKTSHKSFKKNGFNVYCEPI